MNTIRILTIIVSLLTVVGLIVSLLKNAKIKNFSLYWLVSLCGAVIVLLLNIQNIKPIIDSLFTNSQINPLKILVFFLCMTILSITLDNLNFFKFIATKCVRLAKNSQIKLFLIFYILVSILTVFTSNDIVILSFVPFICYFCKSAKLNPAPYVFSTFVAANTWSMLFVIGNPTNVYLASFAGIDFVTYFLKMALPTIVCGVASLGVLLLLFRKHLKQKIEEPKTEQVEINKPLVILNATILLICTVLLAISSYVGLEMWYIAVGFVVLELVINFIICFSKKYDTKYLFNSLKRAPWAFVPFLISMFLIIMCLDVNGVTAYISKIFTNGNSILTYGITSFLFSNILNNIPMTALFSQIISHTSINMSAVYASIIGSNLGALFTPIGALAGIMFLNILKEKDVDFSIKSFIKYGVIVSVVSLALSLFMLWII